MEKITRNEMIKAMANLLQTNGYNGTGMNDIVKHSGAPKGSIYYYFPGGKEQLAIEAIEWTTEIVTKKIKEELDAFEDPAEAIINFIVESANRFDEGKYIYGAPISIIALEQSTTNENIRKACDNFFMKFSEEITAKLIFSGYEKVTAIRDGRIINSMIQGAFVLAVSSKNSIVFREVANKIPEILQD